MCFVTRKLNEAGIYAIKFYVNGIEKIVVIDDYIPIEQKFESQPVFSHSKVRGEIWMCLIEKAWAKLHGSYAQIIEGKSDDVFLHLTNKPT